MTNPPASPAPPPAGPSSPDVPSTAPRITRLPADATGSDPAVRDYAHRHHATCAARPLSWSWLAIGFGAALLGGLAGDWLAGPASPLPPDRGQLSQLLNHYLGNPLGVVLGMAGGAVVASVLGAWLNRHRAPSGQEPWFGALMALAIYLSVHDWLIALSVFTGAITLVYFAAIAFRLLVLAAGGERGLRPRELVAPPGGWPRYTVLVPLYRERNVAGSILAHLEKLDYPREQLDVKFLLEADDAETLEALRAAGIPAWAEVIVAPLGQPKTKPRACNHGLAAARGDYLVIYDAEDRPDPDQLKLAATAFAHLEPRVVCLQAQLAYHNHRQNLLTRWFALEYNVWFRRYLAGLVRLGVPIPLGGTSNHFRTAALREVGGWDPFNVTEDCDLGVRLAVARLSTRTLDSTTWEEANSRVGNWLRQRSRWMKGYFVTHLVWGRRPLALVGKLGPWGALGFVLSVFCVPALAALNLVLWLVAAVYLALLGLDLAHGHALWQVVASRDRFDSFYAWQMWFSGPPALEDPWWSTLSQVFFVASVCLLAGNFAFILINALAGRRPGQRGLWWAALISPLYWVLISLGAWKGIWQLLTKPHYWEKTVHGLDQPDAAKAKSR